MFDSKSITTTTRAGNAEVAGPLTALFVAAPLLAWGLLLTAGLLLIGTVALGALALQVAALVGVEVISGRRQHARP
jgi:ABC-type enterobactin transport system permease subunit